MLEALVPHTSRLLTLLHTRLVNRIDIAGAGVEGADEAGEREEEQHNPAAPSHLRRRRGPPSIPQVKPGRGGGAKRPKKIRGGDSGPGRAARGRALNESAVGGGGYSEAAIGRAPSNQERRRRRELWKSDFRERKLSSSLLAYD